MSEGNLEFTVNPMSQYRVELPEDIALLDLIRFLNGLNIRHFGTDVDRECLPPGFRKFLVPDAMSAE